ncbi:hypothetical protein KW794_03460 [Candidatus Saccharibacteria bacterium]|nr:hypothetical protein [Candidatus Saccharibacteria bacterium]
MSNFEIDFPEGTEENVRNLRREPWSETGLFMTLYDLKVGDQWVQVKAHDFGTTVFDYPDGTKIIDDPETTVTLHANRDMTVVRKTEESIEEYSAEFLDSAAAGLAQAIRQASESQHQEPDTQN